MDEQFLHYIWKYQKISPDGMRTTKGKPILVFDQGNHNANSGPDFEEARIKIGEIEWVGHVEIHLRSSLWERHQHQDNQAYKNVILHVVWQHDQEIFLGGQPIPTIELKNFVDLELVHKYKNHISLHAEIPCTSQLGNINPLTISGMMDRTLVDRLENKARLILDTLKKTTNDWEEATYRTIAACFGFSTNKASFLRLTEVLPFAIIKKVLHNEKSTEALLFGQAGFLDKEIDPYQKSLKEEFNYLTRKFQLGISMRSEQWKFGRLRPANFPAVRLSQLAALMHYQPQLFTLLIESPPEVLKKKLLVPVSSYWQSHYDFGKLRKNPTASMGISSFENLLINGVVPLLSAYAKHTGIQELMDKSIDLLESLSAENNRIIKKWNALCIQPQSAFDSQALIELFHNYCLKRKCLQCTIGVELLAT